MCKSFISQKNVIVQLRLIDDFLNITSCCLTASLSKRNPHTINRRQCLPFYDQH